MDLQALDALIIQAMPAWPVAGLAVAVVHKERVIFAQGYGVRSLGTLDYVDEHTVFAIASCTKAFTSAALAMLVDEGRVKLDDPVITYLPEFQLYDPYVTREITVRDILCHRSGLPTFGGDLLWFGTTYTRRDILRRIRYLKPTSSFRSHFGYQNTMYLAAGQIVEVVSGTSWDTFVQDRIFNPLGMTSTTTSISAFASHTHLALPHIRRNGNLQQIPYLNIDNEAPAGGINSTVLDMTHWLQLQLGRGTYQDTSLISPTMVQEMWSPQTIIAATEQTAQLYPTTHFQTYGLGWFLRDYHGRKVIEHDGGLPGMVSTVGLIPEEQVGFVILSNSESAFVRVLRNSILDLALGVPQQDWSAVLLPLAQAREEQAQNAEHTAEEQQVRGTQPSLALTAYAGEYTGQLYGTAVVDADQGKLLLRLVPAPQLAGDLEHWHYDTFRVTWRDPYIPKGFVTFILDAQGCVSEMKIDSPNPDFDFTELELKRVPDVVLPEGQS